MLDFDVQRCTRRCSGSDRELKAGEWVYSALVPRGAQVLRLDFALDAWKGPPENAIGWWKGRVPEGGNQRTAWAPNDVMLDYFEHLESRPDKADVRYVLALLLVRRRVIRLENTLTDDQGNETLVIFCPRNEQESRVEAILPDDQRVAEIQTELSTLLFGDSSSLMPPPPEPTAEPLAEPHDQPSGESTRESLPPTNSESPANSALKVVGLDEQSADEESAEAEADETSLAGALADETDSVEAESDEAEELEDDAVADELEEDELDENDDDEDEVEDEEEDDDDEEEDDEEDVDDDEEDEDEDDEEDDEEEVDDEEEDKDEEEDEELDEEDDEAAEASDADADESDDSDEEPGESS